jgi:hypothetical protein
LLLPCSGNSGANAMGIVSMTCYFSAKI